MLFAGAEGRSLALLLPVEVLPAFGSLTLLEVFGAFFGHTVLGSASTKHVKRSVITLVHESSDRLLMRSPEK